MKIVIINNNPEGRGTFWRSFGFAKYLVKAGHAVTLLCLQDKKCFKISAKTREGVEITLLPCNFNGGFKELPGHLVRICLIVFFILKRKFDIAHFFNVAFPTCGIPVFFLWFFKKIGFIETKLIVDWDDLWGKEGLTCLNNQGWLAEDVADFFEKKIPLLADEVTVVSDEIKRRALLAGVKPEKIHKVINGADIDAVKPIDMYQARILVGLSETEKIICYAASIRMSLDYVISSFEKVVKKVGNVRLILLNRIDDEVKEMISKSKAKNKISLMGFQPYEKYLQYLAASDVVLLPRSNHIIDKCEFPGRLGDIMALGKPVVTNNSGDAWKIIEESQSGLVANVDDPDDFSQKVVRMLNDRKLIIQLSENARKAAEGKYSWEKITKELIQKVYEAN